MRSRSRARRRRTSPTETRWTRIPRGGFHGNERTEAASFSWAVWLRRRGRRRLLSFLASPRKRRWAIRAQRTTTGSCRRTDEVGGRRRATGRRQPMVKVRQWAAEGKRQAVRHSHRMGRSRQRAASTDQPVVRSNCPRLRISQTGRARSVSIGRRADAVAGQSEPAVGRAGPVSRRTAYYAVAPNSGQSERSEDGPCAETSHWQSEDGQQATVDAVSVGGAGEAGSLVVVL